MRQYASVAIRIQIIHNKGVLQHLFSQLHQRLRTTDAHITKRSSKNEKSHVKQNHAYTCTGVCTVWIEDGIKSVIFFDVMNRKFKQ